MATIPYPVANGQTADGDQMQANLAALLAAINAFPASLADTRGHFVKSGSDTTTSAVAVDLGDKVSGVVLPANGLIVIAYQALWKISGGGGVVGVYLGANQVKKARANGAPIAENNIGLGSSLHPSTVYTTPTGLASDQSPTTDSSNVTTGQLVGGASGGGFMAVFAAAGTYDVGIKYTSDGASTLTVQDRRLFVGAMAF